MMHGLVQLIGELPHIVGWLPHSLLLLQGAAACDMYTTHGAHLLHSKLTQLGHA